MMQNYYKYLKQFHNFSTVDTFFSFPRVFFFFFNIEVGQSWIATSQLKDAVHASEVGLKF